MALGLTSIEAQAKLLDYAEEINRVSKLMERNFEDMDFENADKRDKMEAYIKEIKRKCNLTLMEVEQIQFE